MRRRRRDLLIQPLRRFAVVLLASGSTSLAAVPACGQEAVAEVLNPSPAERATAGPSDLILTPPINSTLEIRVARRPWLLEKLTGPKTEPSIKMTPPSPPEGAAIQTDPPSLGKPILSGEDLGWQLRKHAGVAAENPTQSLRPNQTASESKLKLLIPAPQSSKPSTADTNAPTADSELPAIAEGSASEMDESGESDADPVSVDQNESIVDDTPPIEPPGEVEQIRVRELRIDVDGTPLNSYTESGPTRQDRNDAIETANEAANDALELNSESLDAADDEGSANGARVGDLDPEPYAPGVELDYTGFPKQPLQLNRSVRSMYGMMRACLQYYYARPDDANERSNWGVMHSMMVYGTDTKIMVGKRSYNAIAWIAGNNACRGQKILSVKDDRITALNGVGLQGHQAQLLAILSLCDVPFDYTLYADNQRFTVGDLIESDMLACRSGEELTFTLIGLAHYLDTDIVWRNADGEIWDFERLIREELSQPVIGAACGGTHRLMGFAHALRKRRAEGKPISGQWRRAEIFTNDFVKFAYRLQNRDGSMTTDWFEGREDNGDLDRKIQTTGHIVEWLLTVTPDSELQDGRLVAAIRFLMKSLYEERNRNWSIGPKGHALRSLAMYYERVYRSGPAWRTPSVARSSQTQR